MITDLDFHTQVQVNLRSIEVNLGMNPQKREFNTWESCRIRGDNSYKNVSNHLLYLVNSK